MLKNLLRSFLRISSWNIHKNYNKKKNTCIFSLSHFWNIFIILFTVEVPVHLHLTFSTQINLILHRLLNRIFNFCTFSVSTTDITFGSHYCCLLRCTFMQRLLLNDNIIMTGCKRSVHPTSGYPGSHIWCFGIKPFQKLL